MIFLLVLCNYSKRTCLHIEMFVCNACPLCNACWLHFFFKHSFISSCTIADLRLPITRAASANQNVTDNILCEKPEERPPCLACKLKHTNRARDWWTKTKTFEISDGMRSLVSRDIRYNHTRQISFTWTFQSAANHRTFHKSTQLVSSLVCWYFGPGLSLRMI